ncbi:PIN domain-containing protein [Candidatus Poribacteria bacterium]|nr:PIN domain-containing protein [Candidatus Poribacteria bacterium]
MAKNEYFIDTSAFIALIYKDDQYHNEALQIQEEIDRKGMLCVTTDYVLTEVYAFLVSRVGRFAANLFDQALQEEENLIIIFQGEFGFHKAQELFRQYSDKDYSLVDCASFATMQARGLNIAFAFDEDFKHFGFQLM